MDAMTGRLHFLALFAWTALKTVIIKATESCSKVQEEDAAIAEILRLGKNKDSAQSTREKQNKYNFSPIADNKQLNSNLIVLPL